MNFNALDLNLVRVFDALMAERSATRAGERIGLSQPAVSAALSRLRHALGDQLFIRRGHDMVPTPRAEELAALARSALSQIEQMVDQPGPFDPSTLERQFTIMGSDFVSMLLMPRLSQRIRQLAPRVVLRLRDTSIGDVARQLREDSVDVAIEPAIAGEEGVSSRTLFVSPFLVVARRSHPQLVAARLVPGDVIPIDLYCALPHALRSVDGGRTGPTDMALARAGHRRQVMLTMPQFEAIALAVAEGDYLAALPGQFAEAAARKLPLDLYRQPVEAPAADIRMLWHARHNAERAHHWLREKIVETVAELGMGDRSKT